MSTATKLALMGILIAIVGACIAVLSSPPVNTPPVKLTFTNEQLRLDKLRPGMTEPLDSTESDDQLIRRLTRNGSLHLVDACLVVGEKKEPQRVITLSVHTLSLSNKACIKTNGQIVYLTVVDLVSDGGTIRAFGEDELTPPDSPPLIAGAVGRNAGKVVVRVLRKFVGPLLVDLRGENGGRGGSGAAGAQGPPGNRGGDAVSGIFGCQHGGDNGARGGVGGQGWAGVAGGRGGDGGTLVLRGVAARQRAEISYELDGGIGGTGGYGGPGGPGGPGGQGGSGGGFCGGGRAGEPGPV